MAEEQFDAVVNVSADTSAAKAEVADLQHRIREMERSKLKIRADATQARLEVAQLKRQIEAGASFGLTDTKAKAQLAVFKAEVRDLATVKLKVDVDTLRARAQLAELKELQLSSTAGDLASGAQSGLSGLQSLVAEAGNLNRSLSQLPAPILAAAAAGAVLTGAFLATTAAVGGTVTVVGVLGAVALKENEKIKDAFLGTAGEIQQEFTLTAEKLIPSFVRISDEARKSFSRILPDLDRLVAASGPAIEGIASAAGSFAEKTVPGFRALAEASGPVIEGLKDFSSNVGGAVNDLLQKMASSSEGAGGGLRLLGDAVSSSVEVLGDFVFLANQATAAIDKLSQATGGEGGFDIKGLASQNPIGKFLLDVDSAIDKYQELNQKVQASQKGGGFRLPANLVQEIEARNKALRDEAASRQRLKDLQTQNAPLSTLDSASFQTRVDTALGGYEQLKTAAQSLAQAEANQATVSVQAARSEAAARKSVAAAAQNVRDTQESGLRQIAAAERAVADAQVRTRTAQEDLTQARKDAARAIVDMQRTLRDLPDTEESARLSLARAQLNAEKVGVKSGLTPDQLGKLEEDVQKRSAVLDLKNAQEDLNDAIAAGQQTRADAADMERKGVEGAPVVLNAKTALANAVRAQQDAEKALGQTRVDAAKATAAANAELASANENLNNTLQDNAIKAAAAAAQTDELRKSVQKAQTEADILAASMGLTSDQLAQYSDKVNQVPTLALKLDGETDVISALDAVTIKARAIQLLALNPSWTAEKATQEASAEITGKKTILDAINKVRASTAAMFQFRATGGKIFGPGTSTSDSVPVMASAGEFMQPADAVNHYGTDFMEAVRTKRLPKFATGGLIDFPLANFRGLAKTLEDNGLYQRVRENAKRSAARPATPAFSASGPAPTGQLADWIAAAMSHTGVPDSWRGPLNTLIMRESGGNPSARNDWDINAQNGVPSQGLMQTIPPTFAAYRDPSLPNNIVDPVANIVAGINYIRARYGSIFNVQQANASAPPQGYKDGGLIFDEGGVLPTGRTIMDNRTGKPEPLLRADKSIDLSSDTILALVRTLAQALSTRPAQLMLPNGRVLADTVSENLVSGITSSGVTQ